LIHDHNIVCVASNWFDHPTSKHHVMRHLAAQNHVLWVNFHASRRPRLTRGDTHMMFRRLRQTWTGIRRVAPQIDVLSPLLIPLPGLPLARAVNGCALARQVTGALRSLPRRPTQLWLFTPDVPELIQRLDARRVVYYCVDDFAAFSGYNTNLMETLERRTIAASDVIITTSSKLYEERRRLHPRVHLVPHGVDFEHFARAPQLPPEAVPADLRAIRGPIFGYMGLITDYMDWPLIARAARARPDWSFVLLGDVRCDVGAVSGLRNVHLLGGRAYEQLPAYCRGFDVGLIPFSLNRLTRAVNPIKLREYLAAGLPVVSAPLATVLRYRPSVQTAVTLDEFLVAGETALRLAHDGNQRERQELVRSEGWDARVEELSDLVDDGAGGEAALTESTQAAR
jgi:glycosyltransferase involved in cell wall biosynthesis